MPEEQSEKLLHEHLIGLTHDSMYKALHEHQCALNLEAAVDSDGDEELTVGADIIAAEAAAAMESISSEEEELADGEEPGTRRTRKKKKKKKPSEEVGWTVGDILMVRWYHPDSVGSQFRSCFYSTKVTEVYTNTTGKKTYTVQHDDNAVEENVKHRNTKAL